MTIRTGTDIGPQADDDLDDVSDDVADDEVRPADRPRWLLYLLSAVVAISLLVAGGAIAVIFRIGGDSAAAAPAERSVDVGFCRDMSTHHRQGVEMAGVVRDNSTDPDIRLLAYDIESTQLNQVGQMTGLLVGWGRPQFGGTVMAWMADGGSMAGMSHTPADGLMPGMATQAELDKLKTLSGSALDVYFLQLMLRHHQGGLPMAQYAAEHATTEGVRDLATGIAKAQAKEIVLMEQLLRERGASPLPVN